MHEVYCFVAATQVVRAYGAPRYDQTVVLIGGDLRERLLHRERVTGVDVAVHGLGVPRLEAYDLHRAACFLYGLLRLFELHLLGAYRGQEDGYLLALYLVGHWGPPFDRLTPLEDPMKAAAKRTKRLFDTSVTICS